jgi:hypothetical protein
MTGQEPRSPAAVQQVIYRALRNAVGDTGPRIHRPPGLAGAYLSGPRVHAYVVAIGGSYQVDLWKPNGRDPYRSTVCADLDSAVHAALAAVTL